MTVTVALAGDVMLGRGVAQRLAHDTDVIEAGVTELTRAADLFVCNLECCISTRGQPWADPRKPFFFRAPPMAAEVLADAGIDAVTLANNHALDYGPVALHDTLAHLDRVGIAHTGAGADVDTARQPAVLVADGLRIGLLGLSDHPSDFAAGADRPGIAYADLAGGLPAWVRGALAALDVDLRLVSPHWGPNMVTAPVDHVRAAAGSLAAVGADAVAGHSAHVPHGVAQVDGTAVLYDLGDFLDDYAVDPWCRNDLGLLWLLHVDAAGIAGVEAVPLRLDYCRTTLAGGADAWWMARRLRTACAELDTEVTVGDDGRLTIGLAPAG